MKNGLGRCTFGGWDRKELIDVQLITTKQETEMTVMEAAAATFPSEWLVDALEVSDRHHFHYGYGFEK